MNSTSSGTPPGSRETAPEPVSRPTQDASAEPTRLSRAEPQERLDPSGFDPSRERFAGIGLRKKRRAGNEQRAALKLKTYLRDKQGNRCFFCRRRMTTKLPGERMRGTDATLEHMEMRVHGGAMSEANCVAACFDCNVYRNHAAWGRVYLRTRFRAVIRWLAGRLDLLSDSDGSPEGGDGEAGSVRSTTARAEGKGEGIAKPERTP